MCKWFRWFEFEANHFTVFQILQALENLKKSVLFLESQYMVRYSRMEDLQTQCDVHQILQVSFYVDKCIDSTIFKG